MTNLDPSSFYLPDSNNPPHVVGPTWRRGDDGKFLLPESTLAWQILAWANQYVISPNGGEAFMPTKEQARFLAWWYAVDDEGRFIYRQGVLRRLKGWGKDPLGALMALINAFGPDQFSHFDSNGKPVGVRRHNGWVQIAAVSQDQTKNTFTLFPAMISDKMRKEYGIKINFTIIHGANGCRIEAVTSSPKSLEGNRPTFVLKNETQWWNDSNGGTEMSGVIEGNILKGSFGGARVLAICNGHVPGQDSDAEKDYETFQSILLGERPGKGFLYDALEAPADTPVSEIPPMNVDPEGYKEGVARLREGILIARGDATWLDVDTIQESFFNKKNPVSESRRKFLNQINAAEDAWLSPFDWDARFRSDLRLMPGDEIAMAFDGSKSDDTTGLVACRVSDGALFVLHHWIPEHFGGEIPRVQVDAAVRRAFELYKVSVFRADVKEFESYIDNWSRDFKRKLKFKACPSHVVQYDMRGMAKDFAKDCERFHTAVIEGEVIHDGNRRLRDHVTNAHRYPTTWETISIRKPSRGSKQKIDLAVCAVMAWGARASIIADKKQNSGGVVRLR